MANISNDTAPSRAILGAMAAAGVLLAIAIGAFGSPQAAFAQESPPNCFANAMSLTLARDPASAGQGDTIEYRVVVRNNIGGGSDACDITGADITFVEPAADGTFTGTQHSLATNHDLPASGTGDVCFRSSTAPASLACPAGTTQILDEDLSYVVNVNDDVTSIAAGAVVNGDQPATDACPFGAASLHDNEPASDACAAASISTVFVPPTPTPSPTPTAVALTQTPSPTPTPAVLAQALPAALPAAGGDDGSGMGTSLWLVLAITGAALVAGGGAVAVARRRI